MNLCLELLNSLNEEVIKKTSFYFGKIINDVSQLLNLPLKFNVVRSGHKRNTIIHEYILYELQGVQSS